jgi:uncharacterized protein (TIGR02145 family)
MNGPGLVPKVVFLMAAAKPLPCIISSCSKEGVSFTCGVPVEYEGRMYKTVLAGDQCWFAENLNAGFRVSGEQDQVPKNGFIEKYCYNDDPVNCEIYGGLYQWNEMMNGLSAPGSRGVCPEGWHVPSDAEWTVLFDFLGGRPTAGMEMKSGYGWYNNGNGRDTLGLSVLPGGDRDYDGTFSNLLKTAVFWNSSGYDETYAWSNKFGYQHSDAFRNYYNKKSGFSVRCLKDEVNP